MNLSLCLVSLFVHKALNLINPSFQRCKRLWLCITDVVLWLWWGICDGSENKRQSSCMEPRHGEWQTPPPTSWHSPSDAYDTSWTSGGLRRSPTPTWGREIIGTPSAKMLRSESEGGLNTPYVHLLTTSQAKHWTGIHRWREESGGQSRPGEDQSRRRQRWSDWRGLSWRELPRTESVHVV